MYLCHTLINNEKLLFLVHSMVEMLQTLLTENPKCFILTGKFSQDPLEQHFSAQRRRCGGSTNPTIERFGYNELALHCIKSKNVKSLRGNCKVQMHDQVDFMNNNDIPLKRRKKTKFSVFQ